MSTLDLDAIRKRAEAATPGPWTHYRSPNGTLNEVQAAQTPPPVAWPAFDDYHRSHDDHAANAAHIAGMDPTTTLALLAEVEQLRARCAAAVSYFLPNGDRVGVAFYDDGQQSDKWIAISAALRDSLKADDGKVILFPTADLAFAALAKVSRV